MSTGHTDSAIYWLRRDLRLSDNPALRAAAEHQRLVVLYIFDADDALGAASKWWLHHSLLALDHELRKLGSCLIVRLGHAPGHAQETLDTLIHETQATAVYWNRQYTPAQLARDSEIKRTLRARGLRVESFNANLLLEPWQNTRDGLPYKVFTPFWKACLKQGINTAPLATPTQLPPAPSIHSTPLDALHLLPNIPWDTGLRSTWNVGEHAAWQQLQAFFAQHLNDYPEGRNRPAEAGSSRLSPHLAFGEISPHQIVHALHHTQSIYENAESIFLSELGWREFGYHLLYHFPHTQHAPLNPRWNVLQWPETNPEHWRAWTHGQTGIPLVDAGMRELWHTGWMHNRVRMNAASLLVKNMLTPWQQGERWFADTLVDFDLASNVQGWQWTAGCGADAAPYFRIFNPVLQGEKFDPNGDYIRRWIPELAAMPNRWLHRPWEAPASILQSAGITLGIHYPHPMVDLAVSRKRALDFFSHLKTSTYQA